MKVLFISDYSLNHTIGGAQRSNDLIYRKGKELGHEITMLHIDMDYTSILNKKYDVVISSNMETFSSYKKDVLDYCCSVDNHSRLEHDMCRYLNNEYREKLFNNCNNAFFLTDHHIYKFKENYGDIFKNVRIVADPIDKTLFCDHGKDRSDEILYAGFMHPYKGTNNFLEFTINNPDKSFVVVGWGDQQYIDFINNSQNIQYLGSAPYESMPQIYNKFKYMYYNPVIDEPFCRSVGEAIMCGMEILGGSDKIGCVNSYNKYGRKKFIEDCHNADKVFWETLDV